MDAESSVEIDAPLRYARPASAHPLPSAPRSDRSILSLANRLLRRRVLTVDEYAAEKQNPKKSSIGEGIVPVPIVLAPGESEAQYEEKFISWLAQRSVTLFDLKYDPNRERQLRISFAERVARAAAASASVERELPSRERTHKMNYISKDGTVDFATLPRHLMLVHEHISLEQFKRDSQRGRFAQMLKLSFEENQERFGSPYAPIFAPLAVGETKDQYEERFVQWLETTRGMTLWKLQHHVIHMHERILRLRFASLNGKGELRFLPPRATTREHQTSDRQEESVPAKKKRKSECRGSDSLTACRACGCRRCLLAAMRLLAKTITSLESKKAESLESGGDGKTAQPPHVVDASLSTRSEVEVETETEETDQIEQQLLEEYDSINEMIVMNESALDASAAEIVELAVTDIAEATVRRDEDDELRDLIEEEQEKRRVALAMVVLYIHRRNGRELEVVVDATHSCNVVHVQKLSHHKCAQLAVEIAETRARLVESPNEKKSSGESESQLQLTAKLIHSQQQRRLVMVTIVRFDQRVRDLIRTLLTSALYR